MYLLRFPEVTIINHKCRWPQWTTHQPVWSTVFVQRCFASQKDRDAVERSNPLLEDKHCRSVEVEYIIYLRQEQHRILPIDQARLLCYVKNEICISQDEFELLVVRNRVRASQQNHNLDETLSKGHFIWASGVGIAFSSSTRSMSLVGIDRLAFWGTDRIVNTSTVSLADAARCRKAYHFLV